MLPTTANLIFGRGNLIGIDLFRLIAKYRPEVLAIMNGDCACEHSTPGAC